MINFDVRCPGDKKTISVVNGADIKEKHYEKIDKIDAQDFKDTYTEEYWNLVNKIKSLYKYYENNERGGDDYSPPSNFVERVREIVAENEKIYEQTCKQIDKYTCKIPPMPWALGCTIKSAVMYILHNPIIKCAVQYFEHYTKIKDETGYNFDQMVYNPENYKHEWHNCMVMFIRLLKLTYEELESNHTDTKVHGKLWNQIQGLEYLMHFLCFAYRRGYFSQHNVIVFLKIFLKILGIFDFGSLEWEGKERLPWSLYCCESHSFSEAINYITQQVNENCDSLCCERGKTVFLRESDEFGNENQKKMFSDIALNKEKRTNYMIYYRAGNHFFHFYKKPNVEGEDGVYYTHDGLYEYEYHGDKIGDICKFCYYEIPFTYIILPELREDLKSVQLDDYFGKCQEGEDFICFWDFFIPLLSPNLIFVKDYCSNLGKNFYNYCEKVEDPSEDGEYSYVFYEFFCCLKSLYLALRILYNSCLPDDNDGKDFAEYLSEKAGGVCAEAPDIVRLKQKLSEGEKEIEKKVKNKKTRIEEKKKFLCTMLNLTKSVFTGDVIKFILECKEDKRSKLSERLSPDKIPEGIMGLFKTYVEAGYFFCDRNFIQARLVIEGNESKSTYSDKGYYKKSDVLKVDWNNTGLKKTDSASFRLQYHYYDFFCFDNLEGNNNEEDSCCAIF